ncbi:MAG: hypothetical protein CL878_02540 [Dehalococcoidia bacterium]|nr:hypothetical protein [Dehalococcoidia bacterium]
MLAVALAWAGLAAWGCTREGGSSEQRVEGVLVAVESRDITVVETFTLQDADGERWRFHVAAEAVSDPRHPITAAHLRLHMTAVDRLAVTYRVTESGPVAYSVVDLEAG